MDLSKPAARVLPLLLVAALGLAACGGDPDEGDDVAAPDTPTASPTPDDAAGGDDTVPAGTVTIVGVDYAFEDVPAEVPAGTELGFRNNSEEEVHELVLVRLPDVEERGIEELLQLSPEEQEELLGEGLVGVSVAPPGADGTVVEGELVVDEPGRYLMVCFVPTGADPDEFMAAAAESEGPPEVEGGPPHVVQGMYAELTVTE
jgi:hypothetical protein